MRKTFTDKSHFCLLPALNCTGNHGGYDAQAGFTVVQALQESGAGVTCGIPGSARKVCGFHPGIRVKKTGGSN